jgi:hypothetical protein
MGLGIAVLGIVVYVAQVTAHWLFTPWYVPVAATLGVVLVFGALLRKRSIWRVLALLFLMLIAGFEWLFLFGAGLPTYTGPVAAGRPFPQFTTMRADGTTFTEHDLVADQHHVVVFFRGRW